MILTEKEIIGLNSLLDGQNIPGFKGKMDKSNGDYARETACELVRHGKDKLNLMLRLMNDYKAARKFLVINNGWYAICEKYVIAMVHIADGYEFMGIEQNIFWKELFKMNSFADDRGDERDGQFVSYEPKRWFKDMEGEIVFEAVVMGYEPHGETDICFLYSKNKDRYILNMMTGECQRVAGQTVRKIIKELGSI